MKHASLNRPFVSYILTQSLLVMVVLASSYLICDLMRNVNGMVLHRFWVSVGLVAVVQLPAALIYARAEDRKLEKIEGWAVSMAFVGVTLAVEVLLQGVMQQIGNYESGQSDAGLNATMLILSLGIVAVTIALMSKVFLGTGGPGGRGKAGRGILAKRPSVMRDYSELYRRELIGANIAIFGLSLLAFGPQFVHVLKLSIPLSFMFSLVCVANRMAREERVTALSARCLNVALQLLPLTVVSMGMLALSTLYANYVLAHGGALDAAGYFTWMVTGLGLNLTDLAQVGAYTGVLFAICLSANTLMLVLFARLIRPLVNQTVRTARRSYAPVSDQVKAVLNAPVEVKITMAKDLRDRILKNTTPRPCNIFID